MRRFRIPMALGVLCSGLRLGGRSGHAGINAFDRDTTENDTLPVEVELTESIDAPSVRLLATNSEDKSVGCVIAYCAEDAYGWVAGCGAPGAAGEVVQV